ncbi:MAG: hypothetical protein C0467_27055 [Planctomycetaceae bacterium]|nr:hypothetical protein [Planctomycetaceae bacterium]
MRTLQLLAAVFVLTCAAPVAAQTDLRAQYGTDNLDAAKLIQKGMQASTAGRPKDAIASLREAIKLDPKCGMAHFQLALAHGDAGNIDEAFAEYKVMFADDTRATRNLRALAATNVGLTHGRLGDPEEAAKWFARAVLEDYDNEYQQRAKAYRNLAISLRDLKKPLPAAIAIAMAYEDKARNCDINMVREFFKNIGTAESARVLRVESPPPIGKPRATRPDLEEVKLDVEIDDTIRELLPDPAGKYVLALTEGASFFLITPGEKLAVRKIETAAFVGACLVDGALYLSRTKPDRFDRVDVQTGKTLASHELDKPAPKTFFAAPARGRVFFPLDGVVHQFDMKSRKVTATNTPGHVVAGHPGQHIVYSYQKPDRQAPGGFVVIDGRVFQVARPVEWMQATLFASVITPTGLLLAEARDNAASNASRLVVGVDGSTIALVGGGGYRPTQKSAAGGYGVAVFDSSNTETPKGFFGTGAYPLGVCINPVTVTVAAANAGKLSVYPIGSEATEDKNAVSGKWSGVMTWAGDGRTLIAARSGKGVTAYQIKLTQDEEAIAAKAAVMKPVPLIGGNKLTTAVASPIDSLKTFAVPAEVTPEVIRQVITRVTKFGRSERPTHWAAHPTHAKDDATIALVSEAIKALRSGSAEVLGIALYKLKKANTTTPNVPPIQFFLAELQARKDMAEDAEAGFIAAIRGDAGQTDITPLALEGLARLYSTRGDKLKAAYCRASALEVDKADPRMIRMLVESLRAAKLDADADSVAKLGTATGTTETAGPVKDLPVLPDPGVGGKLSGEAVYELVAQSVVVIKTQNGSGSGVCVGRGDLILTNAHVVDAADEVTVLTFTLKDKTLVRGKETKAKVIYRSESADLAVVRLPEDGPKLVPLGVALASPKAGAKVYAIGSPGLGRDVLEQSISDGVVAAAARKIDDRPYIQHSAAVNPGNSGGPLVDDAGRVVGIVTLKAKLDNVGFAVPVEVVRSLFPTAKK